MYKIVLFLSFLIFGFSFAFGLEADSFLLKTNNSFPYIGEEVGLEIIPKGGSVTLKEYTGTVTLSVEKWDEIKGQYIYSDSHFVFGDSVTSICNKETRQWLMECSISYDGGSKINLKNFIAFDVVGKFRISIKQKNDTNTDGTIEFEISTPPPNFEINVTPKSLQLNQHVHIQITPKSTYVIKKKDGEGDWSSRRTVSRSKVFREPGEYKVEITDAKSKKILGESFFEVEDKQYIQGFDVDVDDKNPVVGEKVYIEVTPKGESGKVIEDYEGKYTHSLRIYRKIGDSDQYEDYPLKPLPGEYSKYSTFFTEPGEYKIICSSNSITPSVTGYTTIVVQEKKDGILKNEQPKKITYDQPSNNSSLEQKSDFIALYFEKKIQREGENYRKVVLIAVESIMKKNNKTSDAYKILSLVLSKVENNASKPNLDEEKETDLEESVSIKEHAPRNCEIPVGEDRGSNVSNLVISPYGNSLSFLTYKDGKQVLVKDGNSIVGCAFSDSFNEYGGIVYSDDGNLYGVCKKFNKFFLLKNGEISEEVDKLEGYATVNTSQFYFGKNVVSRYIRHVVYRNGGSIGRFSDTKFFNLPNGELGFIGYNEVSKKKEVRLNGEKKIEGSNSSGAIIEEPIFSKDGKSIILLLDGVVYKDWKPISITEKNYIPNKIFCSDDLSKCVNIGYHKDDTNFTEPVLFENGKIVSDKYSRYLIIKYSPGGDRLLYVAQRNKGGNFKTFVVENEDEIFELPTSLQNNSVRDLFFSDENSYYLFFGDGQIYKDGRFFGKKRALLIGNSVYHKLVDDNQNGFILEKNASLTIVFNGEERQEVPSDVTIVSSHDGSSYVRYKNAYDSYTLYDFYKDGEPLFRDVGQPMDVSFAKENNVVAFRACKGPGLCSIYVAGDTRGICEKFGK